MTSTIIGIHFINNAIVIQAQNKVWLDLNTASEVYNGHAREIKTLLEFSANCPSILNLLAKGNHALLAKTMLHIYEEGGLDILNVTDADLRVVFRCRKPERSGDWQGENIALAKACNSDRSIGATQYPKTY